MLEINTKNEQAIAEYFRKEISELKQKLFDARKENERLKIVLDKSRSQLPQGFSELFGSLKKNT